MSTSCFYEGSVRHRRRQPGTEFTDPLTLAYLDLDELPGLMGGRLVKRGPGPLRFRRRDYLGATGSLDEAVRGLVVARTGSRPRGPIRILTQLRSFGICFNPVSFYYCFEPGGERLAAVVAEVTNTPWGERHAYVLAPSGNPSATVLSGRFGKALHVSPFMGMDHQYNCRASTPGATLSVHIESERDGEPAFDATLALRRHELSRASVLAMLCRYPVSSLRVLGLIYGHALGLKLAGAPYFPHPRADTA